MPNVSVLDVASRAGVSVGTVSNVLNGKPGVNAEMVKRVREAIDELGFTRNGAARQLRAGRSKTIALILLDARNPFFMDVARGAQQLALESGYVVLIADSNENAALESMYLDRFEEQRVHGVLVASYSDLTGHLDRLRRRGIPAVLVDRVSVNASLSSVAVDDIEGGFMATTHLIEGGRRRIAFVGGPMDIPQVADRLEGARRAVAAHPDVTLQVVLVEARNSLAGRSAGEQLLRRAASDQVDAVFAENDLLAMGVLQEATARAIDVPDRLAIIGYDDIDTAATAVVPLSSIRQPSSLMGETAVRLLLESASDAASEAQQVLFKPELIVRRSTARTPSSNTGDYS